MNTINFEGLGISLKVNKIATQIFGIKIYWYAICIVAAIIIGIILAKRDDGKYHIKFEEVLKLMLFVIPISIISARLYYIIFRWDYYLDNPGQIINIRNGGLAIYGAIIGAVITIIVFCKRHKIKILDMLDYIAPYLALGQAIGRWGNFFNTEAYGIETTSLFRMGIMENGKYIQVHPTFLYESICTLIIFILLYNKRNKREYSGQMTFLYFFLYGITRAIIEPLRTDSLMIGSFRVSQLVSITLAVIFGAIILYHEKDKINKKAVALGTLVIGLDQIVKYLMINKKTTVIPKVLNLTYTKNTGAAFGLGSNNVVMIISIIIITALLIYLIKKRPGFKTEIPFILVISGTIGNLIDRAFRGFVIDYIDLKFIKFPNFNIADICITVGILWIGFLTIKKILKK